MTGRGRGGRVNQDSATSIIGCVIQDNLMMADIHVWGGGGGGTNFIGHGYSIDHNNLLHFAD